MGGDANLYQLAFSKSGSDSHIEMPATPFRVWQAIQAARDEGARYRLNGEGRCAVRHRTT